MFWSISFPHLLHCLIVSQMCCTSIHLRIALAQNVKCHPLGTLPIHFMLYFTITKILYWFLLQIALTGAAHSYIYLSFALAALIFALGCCTSADWKCRSCGICLIQWNSLFDLLLIKIIIVICIILWLQLSSALAQRTLLEWKRQPFGTPYPEDITLCHFPSFRT